MPKPKTPLRPGTITILGVLLAIAAIAAGSVGIRDALLAAGVGHGRPWLERGIDALDGMKPQWWLVPIGIALALLGLWLLAVAVRPRPRTAVRLRAETGVFLRPKDLVKLATAAADGIDGVLSAHVTASRRLTQVSVTVTGNDERMAQDVRTAVAARLAALAVLPRLKVKTQRGVTP